MLGVFSWIQSRSEKSPSLKHIFYLLLNLLKPHKSTRLTFQMIEKPSQCSELLHAPSSDIWTVVYLLFVRLRVGVPI